MVVLWIGLFLTGRGPRADLIDQPILEAFESLRTSALTRVMKAIEGLGSETTVVVLAWTGIAVALVYRRYRHVTVFLACIIVTTWITSTMSLVFTRPRPESIQILAPWNGFSHPSRPVAALALCLVGLTYMLVPQGRWRVARDNPTGEEAPGVSRATWLIAAAVGVLGVARIYLGLDHPTDFVFGFIIGIAIPLVAFRTLVPAEVFPVTYRRGRAAHLDISGRRGRAIVQALREQLGLEVLGIEYHALEGSGGSTPLRIRVAGADDVLFGKLYAANHLRADRWYKLGRTLLYGRLEDEFSFSTVRRLVQYEDYLLRLMRGAGLPSPEPYGFVEITPEREYLIVTEFFTGAREVGDVKVDEQVVDDALAAVGALWEAGLAHRDIKPSNILVRDRPGAGGDGESGAGPAKEVLLIDVAFAEVRPSPWRQAVDLANMMLVLALSSDADMVYERALVRFTPDDIAEAFAATRGVTMPTQLRVRLRHDDRDLLRRFRSLTGNPSPIRIQRWSLRRLALLTMVMAGGLLALALVVSTILNLRLLGFPIQLPLSRSFFIG